jgi:hypothetical protein
VLITVLVFAGLFLPWPLGLIGAPVWVTILFLVLPWAVALWAGFHEARERRRDKMQLELERLPWPEHWSPDERQAAIAKMVGRKPRAF